MAEISTQTCCAKQFCLLPESDVIEFIDDTVHFLKGNRVPFLTKYSQAFGGQTRLIVPCRDLLQDIMQLALRKSQNTSSPDAFKQAVSDFIARLQENEPEATGDMSLKFAEIIAFAVFSRRNELAKVLTELVFRQSVDSYLLDYNYNVETVISSDSFSKQNEQLLILELFLAQNDANEGQMIRRVVVEMNVDEARTFVAKLKDIEREILQASQ